LFSISEEVQLNNVNIFTHRFILKAKENSDDKLVDINFLIKNLRTRQ